MSELPLILDAVALLPPRVTAYRRDLGYWRDEPGVPHRDFKYVDQAFGEQIISGLRSLPESQ